MQLVTVAMGLTSGSLRSNPWTRPHSLTAISIVSQRGGRGRGGETRWHCVAALVKHRTRKSVRVPVWLIDYDTVSTGCRSVFACTTSRASDDDTGLTTWSSGCDSCAKSLALDAHGIASLDQMFCSVCLTLTSPRTKNMGGRLLSPGDPPPS